MSKVVAFVGDNGMWGICDSTGRGLVYESEFSKEAAEAVADMINSDNPPSDWEEMEARLMASGHASEASLGAKNKFKPLQPITHVKTGKIYRIMECPKSRKLESTGEAFYEYGDISTGQVWIIAKSEMEDGRFV